MQTRRRRVTPALFVGTGLSYPSFSRVQGAGVNSGGNGGVGGSVSSLALTYPTFPVTAGNLLTAAIYWVSGSGTSGDTFAFTDSLGNTWTVAATGAKSNYHGWTAVAYCVSQFSGTNRVTCTPSAAGEMGLMIDEWSPGADSSFSFAAASAVESATSPLSTAPLVFSGPTPDWLICGYLFSLYQNATLGGESGFTPTTSFAQQTPGFNYLAQYQLATGSASGSAVTGTIADGGGDEGAIGAMAFRLVPPFYPTPAGVPYSCPYDITIRLTGSGTTWQSGLTTFTASGAGVTIVSQSIASPTSATLVIATGPSTGTATISDGTYTAGLAVGTPSVSFSPPGLGPYSTATFAATGTDTCWLSAPAGTPLFAISGVAGATIGDIDVLSDTSATFALTTGAAIGTLAVADTSTGTAGGLTVYPLAPGFAASPAFIPTSEAAATITLTGTETDWSSGTTTFAASGVPGVTIGSQSIASPTSATIAVTTGTAAGTLTLSDGQYTATLAVVPAATVDQVYVGRSGQAIAFTAYGAALTYSPPTSVTQAVVDTAIAAGGSRYTAPSATISGGVSIALTAGGSGYTTAPKVRLSGGGGSGAGAIASVAGGCVTGLTVTPGRNYTSDPVVTFSGGGGTGAAATAAVTVNGGTGCVLGTPIVRSGAIVNVPVVSGGSGYTSAPAIAISDPTGAGASCSAVMGGGQVSVTAVDANPTISVNGQAVATAGPFWSNETGGALVAYQLLSGGIDSVVVQSGGSGYTGTLSASASGGGGTGLVLGTPTVVNGVITSVTPTGTASAGSYFGVTDNAGTGSGFLGYYTVATPGTTGAITGAVIEQGGSGYSTNLTWHVSVSAATVSNGVIATVPVISPGSGYTSAPTIAVSGTGGGSGAVVAPMMSGPGPGDVVTYSAPAGWLATAAGNVPAASGAPVANYAGMLDPWVAQAPRTMPIGMNITSGDGAHGPLGINQNWMTGIQANFIGASQPMSSIGPAYYTASVTHGSATVTFAGVEAGLTGSLVYFPGDTSGNLYTVTGGSGTSWTISPAFGGSSLSGVQCLASPAGSIVIYPAAGDTTGQYAQGIAAVDGSGSIASIAISNPGFGYTLPPNVYIPPPASGGTQATATAGLAGVMGMNVGRRRRPLFGTTAVSGGSVASIVVTAGGSGYCGSTSDGHPIAINGASNPIGGSTSGVPTAYATVAWVQSENSGIGGQVPDQAGTWTFVADESSPSSPMVVTLYSGAGGLDTGPLPGTIVRGTVTGGVEVGKTWSFDVARDGSLGLDLMLCVQGPTASASAPWTLSNEYLTPPRRGTGTANVPDRTAPMAPDPNVTAWLSLPGGVGPAVVRPFPFGALSWGGTAVDPSDLRSTSDFTWWDGPQRNINVVVTAIRAYQTSPGTYSWSSPYVFTSQEYPNTQSSAGIPGAPLPYYWAPANANWIAGYLGGSTDWIAAECVTATPHGLKTGMRITLPSNPILAALQFYDAGSASVVTKDIAGYKTTIFVTGASSFVFCPYTATVASSPSNANITTVYGSVTTPFPMTFLPPVGTQCMPYEAVARMAAALPDCGVWVDVPTSGTDACIAAVAARTRDNTPVGVPVYVEYMNEHWNTNFIDYFNLIVLSNLCAGGATGIAAGNQDQMYAYRASEVHDIFAAVFDEPDANGVAGRGGSIVRVMGSQWTSTASVNAIVAYANAYNTANPSAPIRIDAVCVAPYPDAAQDSAWGSLAAAAYSNYPGSVSYQGNPVLLGTYIDLMKNQIAASAAGGTTASVGNLAAYNTVAGQGAPPQLVCYEASIQSGVADNLSTTDYYLRAWIAHDIYFHPWFRDVETAFEVGCQQAGVALAVNFNACQARTNDPTGGIYELVQGKEDDDGTILWGYTTWEGMTWGLGDGSADGNGDATVNQTFQATGAFQDLANVSPKLQGWRDWAAAANAPPARSTPPARRWFPGLARRPRPAGGR